jgi:hypothetical protein
MLSSAQCMTIKSNLKCLFVLLQMHRYYIEFLDESLRALPKGNILQENLCMVLTSLEMVALTRVMSIIHFKICKPMRWLAGNTHLLGQVGYDWSARSMGKAVDALDKAMIDIAKDGSQFLDEDFMSSIFDEIYNNPDGNLIPPEPLTDAMKFMIEDKQSSSVDGSKVLPNDL